MFTFKQSICFFAFTAHFTSVVWARPDLLTAWQERYPQSNADDIGCQLCHTDAGGDEPWNAYGASIKQIFRANGFDIDEAFELAETVNHDGDPSGANSLDEIKLDRQPGWTEGANNTAFFVDNLGNITDEIRGGMPPNPIATTQIDPARPLDNNPITQTIRKGAIPINLETIADGFTAPVYAAAAPGLGDMLFVVEQTGKIWQVTLTTGDKALFHDVGPEGLNQLVTLSNNYDERGLLGLVFHPDYLNNGLFYTYQSEPISEVDSVDFSTMPEGSLGDHQSVVAQWFVTNPADTPVVSPVRKVLMSIEQPQSNHNGGALAFDQQGLLYISLGDGGAADDQAIGHGLAGNGRDISNPLGSILRIDPLTNNASNGQYGIPINNPFIGQDGVDEIFAYGLRNVSRFSFDVQTGDFYAGDVGQNEIEEINIINRGGNYGWNWQEGSFFFYPGLNSVYGGNKYLSLDAPPSLPNDLVMPLAQYDHDEGRAITGGYVYRGQTITALQGRYVFADWSRSFGVPQGRLFYLDSRDQIKEFQMNGSVGLYVNAFAQDAENELYILGSESLGPTGTSGVLQKLTMGTINDDLCVPIKSQNQSITLVCL